MMSRVGVRMICRAAVLCISVGLCVTDARAQAPDEHRGIRVEPPRHAVGTEQPGVHQSRGVSSTRTDCITSPTCVSWATSMPSTT